MKITVRPANRKTLLLKLLFIGLVIYMLFVCYMFPFSLYERLTGGATCLFKRFAGIPCLFCGLKRSLLSAFRLNLRDALLHNPAGVLIFFGFVFALVNTVLEITVKKRISISLKKREKFIAVVGIALLLLLSWIFKLI